MVENPLAHVGDIRDIDSSLGWEDCLEEGMGKGMIYIKYTKRV